MKRDVKTDVKEKLYENETIWLRIRLCENGNER
jgi:hypothetical protein